MSTESPTVEAKLAEAGLTVSAETLAALKTAATDLEAAARPCAAPVPTFRSRSTRSASGPSEGAMTEITTSPSPRPPR